MFSLTLSNVVVAVSVLASARATCLHGTTFMRRNEGEIPAPTFSYEDETGPLNWHNLNENNTACNTGDMQAPIVLTADIPFASEAPKWHVAPVPEAEFLNLGTTLEVMLKDAGGQLDYMGKSFKLVQCHMHTPSEHRIAREYYPIELHCVHQADSGDLAVVAIPFDLSEDGKTTDFLTAAVKNIADVAEPLTKTKTGPLDFSAIIGAVAAQNLYDYQGSLTTPPCAQGVQFLVLDAPMPVDVKTYNSIKKVIKFNSRPTQNMPGKQNLLQIAAVQSMPGGEEGASGATTGAVDVDALMQAFFESGKKMKYETVTKVETVVTLVDETIEEPPVDAPTDPTEPAPTEPTEPAPTEPTEPAPTEPTEGEPMPTEDGEVPPAPPADDGSHGPAAPGPAAPPVRRARRSNMLKRSL
jgi:carbonic anhydrase